MHLVILALLVTHALGLAVVAYGLMYLIKEMVSHGLQR